jgi:hypothetical protein
LAAVLIDQTLYFPAGRITTPFVHDTIAALMAVGATTGVPDVLTGDIVAQR